MLFFPGIARRARSGDSLESTQNQNDRLNKASAMSGEAQNFSPHEMQRPPHLRLYRTAPTLRIGPGPIDALFAASGPKHNQGVPHAGLRMGARPTDALFDASGPEPDQLRPRQDEDDKGSNNDSPLPTLAPSSSLQAPSRRAIRFREMMAAVTLSDERLAMLDDAGLRTLLRGVQGAAELPLVLDAFTMVYEDLAPVRFAGDLVFRRMAKRLREADEAATKRAAELLAKIQTARQPSEADVVLARKLFDLLDRDKSGKLSRAEIVESGLLLVCGRDLLSEEDIDQFMREVDAGSSGDITFLEFMFLASRVLFEDDGRGGFSFNWPKLLEEFEASHDGGDRDAQRDERFEAMLRAVASWDLDATDNSRFGLVVRGSQVGATDTRVVCALQHLYVNYAPMRMAGNLIFKMMNAHLGRRTEADANAYLANAFPNVQADSVHNYNSVRKALQQNGLSLKNVEESLKNDRDLVQAAVQQNGRALQYASEDLRNDRHIVLAAVQKHGMALKFAGEDLKKDRHIVLQALRQNGQALRFAHQSLKNDRDLVTAAVQQNAWALEYAGEGLKNDLDIVLTAVQQHGSALEFAGQDAKNNRQVALAAVQRNGNALRFAGDDLKRDRGIVLAAVQKNGLALKFAQDNLCNNRGIALAAVQQNEQAVEYIGESLKKDPEFVRERLDID